MCTPRKILASSVDEANPMSPSSSTHTHTHTHTELEFPPVPRDHTLLMRLFLTGSGSSCAAGVCYLNNPLLALSSLTRFHFYMPGMPSPHTHTHTYTHTHTHTYTHSLCPATCSGVCWAGFLLGRDSCSRCISPCAVTLSDTQDKNVLHSLVLLVHAELWSKSSS